MMEKKRFQPQAVIWDSPWEIERLSEFKEDWDVRRTRMKPGSVEVAISFFNTPRMQFSSTGYSNAIFLEGTFPKGSIILSLIHSKGKVFFRNQLFAPHEVIVATSDETLDYLASHANTIFTLAVDETLFDSRFTLCFGESILKIRKENRLMMQRYAVSKFITYMQQWLYYFSEKKELLDSEIYTSIEEEILETLFSMVQTEKKHRARERFDIEKVRETMHEHIDTIYTVGELAKELQISSRTLQYHFRKKLGITPKQYLHQLRLNAIRAELLACSPEEAKISDIILRYGFFRPSHFGAEYKRVFGETPSQTLKREGI